MDEFNGVNLNKNFLIIAIAIAIIAVGAGGFILGKYSGNISVNIPTNVAELEEEKSEVAEKETGKCAFIQNISEKNQCWADLAKEEKDESHCKKISADFPEVRGDCYTELAILKDDSLICEKIISGSLHKSCLEYFEGNDKKDEMADWEIYENDEFGYEIKYPKNWNFYEEKNAVIVTFCGPEYQEDCRMAGKGSSAAIVLRNDSLDIEKENFCQDNPLNIFCNEKILSRENIKVGGKEGEIFNIDVNGNSLYVLWKRNLSDKKMYEISADELKNFPQHQKIFDQMLSTFKFTKADEISDWKIHKDKEYGFEFKIASVFEKIDYEVTKAYFNDEDFLSRIAFETKQIDHNKYSYPKIDEIRGMFFIFIYAQEYCQGKGRDFCDKVRKENDKELNIFHSYLLENKDYFLTYNVGGTSGGDTWDVMGWTSNEIRKNVAQMLSTFKFTNPPYSQTKKTVDQLTDRLPH